jgi:hypothetical protein
MSKSIRWFSDNLFRHGIAQFSTEDVAIAATERNYKNYENSNIGN